MKLEFEYLNTIDSTNDEIRRRAEEGCKEGLIVSAGEQTKGKGRFGHKWESPKANSIATSILLRPDMDVESISQVTILAAMAVSNTISNLYGLKTGIKWPNDVLINNKKICGILTEMKPENNIAKYVIVGIGINVHDQDFPEEIKDIATSIDIELSGKKGSRKELTTAVWKEFEILYEKFLIKKNLSYIKELYNSRLLNKDKKIKVMDPRGEYEAKALGIDECGKLIIEKDGEEMKVDSGEVHVRGLYGYV
ncbi:MAG: biotin--[acetyl-CoA-carboxylase] ligase [Lachnospiraceae bacterium]|nr:biotin--[acetyl-CoA-carboxylase] ligase [Lachnospiraceae bacterium]